MIEATKRWQLDLLHAAQAQKETTHNEALTRIDMLLHPSVEGVGGNIAPSGPVVGEAWIVGSDPQGVWSGAAGSLAAWTAGGWRFVAPQHGMRVWSREDGVVANFLDGLWNIGEMRAARLSIGGQQVVGPRLTAVTIPGGGSVVDIEARTAVVALIDRLVEHGLLENG